MEVGFGGGEHLVQLAKVNRHIGILGCEPYVNGVAKLLPKLIDANITNVRIFMDDARKILDLIPESRISKVFLLFPDPWPKLRHHRRRFINVENVEVIAKILKPGGLLEPWLNWSSTRYQKKTERLGRPTNYLVFQRN